MAKTVIIHGGTGGERKFFAPDLCKHFECDAFILGWNQADAVNVGCLHLTQSYTPRHKGKTVAVDEDLNVVGETIVMPFADAMAAAGFKQCDPANKLREMEKSAALKQADFDFRSGRISYDQLRKIEKRVKEGREPTTEDDELAKLRAEFDKLHLELNHHKARNESKGKLIRRLRGRLQDISDHIEDEGDRKYFGSTNDADDLTDLVHAMDRWRWDDILSKDEGHTDPYADLREQRARAEKAEAEVARLKTLLNDCNATRRYAVFAGAQCYPCGGAADLIGFATTLDDAVTMVDGALKQAVCISADWSHALDVSTGAVLPIPGYSDIRSYVGSPLRSDIDPETGEWSV